MHQRCLIVKSYQSDTPTVDTEASDAYASIRQTERGKDKECMNNSMKEREKGVNSEV